MLNSYDPIEAEWIAEAFLDSKEAGRALELLLRGEMTFNEYNQWFGRFIEGCHLNFLEYQAELIRDSRFEGEL